MRYIFKMFLILLVISANCGGLAAEAFNSYDGQKLPEFGRNDETAYELIGKSVENIYLNKEWKRANQVGKSFTNLEEYELREWPKTKGNLDELRKRMLLFKDVISSYTMVESKITSASFYDSLSTETKLNYGIASFEQWRTNFDNFNSVDNIDRKLKAFPTNAKEAFALYGESLGFENFKERWVLQELEKINPSLTSRLSRQSFLDGMTTSTNPFPMTIDQAESAYENTKSLIFAEISIRIIMSREIGNISFSDKIDVSKFKIYWKQRIQKSLGRGLIPENSIPISW